MTKRIKQTGGRRSRIRSTSPHERKVDPKTVASALGAGTVDVARALARRDRMVVTYVRIRLSVRRRIDAIAKRRGHPHTLASVTAESIAVGLATIEGV